MKNIIYISILIISFSCANKAKQSDTIITELASPFLFQTDTTLFYISDYVINFSELDSVVFPKGIESVKLNDSIFKLIIHSKIKYLSDILLYKKASIESILAINRKKTSITIKYSGNKQFNSLKVIGSMNNWNRGNDGMSLENGVWKQEFLLNPGVYEYLFYSEGSEFPDSENPDKIGNNSRITVGKFLPEDLPFLTTVNFNKKWITLNSNQTIDEIFVFWQNKRIKALINDNKIKINIPKEAFNLKRSFIRARAYNTNGISNDILIPLQNGEVINNVAKLNRSDKQTMIMYFLMVDRFFNGDTSNDKQVNDPDILPMANYFGGDLAGVNQKIEEGYFKDLGVNTIWLSPITQNPEGAYGHYKNPYTKFSGYHGYWPISNTIIDYRFGNPKVFQTLVNKAHNQEMNILLDYVANHVHEDNPIYKQHPEWATPLYLPDGTLNTEKWDEYRLTTWFDTFLPTLDLRKPEVVNAMVDSALIWITKYGIDGFRHDATKHIDELFWRTLTSKIKKVSGKKSIYQIGETYGGSELISSYIGSGMLNAQFDFNVYDNTTATLAIDGESFYRLKLVLSDSWKHYGYNNLMGNISGNQDRGRFISYAGGDLSFFEDAKFAGWNRKIGVGDEIAYEKLKMLHAFNMTIPGIPVIYYGDEVGIPGGNDPDNRRWMKFEGLSDKELDLLETTKKLITIRKNNMALLYGQSTILQADEDIMAFTRNYFSEHILIVLNKSKEEKNVSYTLPITNANLNAEFGSEISSNTSTIDIKLKPISFDIIHF